MIPEFDKREEFYVEYRRAKVPKKVEDDYDAERWVKKMKRVMPAQKIAILK